MCVLEDLSLAAFVFTCKCMGLFVFVRLVWVYMCLCVYNPMLVLHVFLCMQICVCIYKPVMVCVSLPVYIYMHVCV